MSFPVSMLWTELAFLTVSKKLHLQYQYASDGYTIWALDGESIYNTVIYNNAVPDPSLYSQLQNDSDKEDFLTNYAPLANKTSYATAARDGYLKDSYGQLVAGVDDADIVRLLKLNSDGYTFVIGGGPSGAVNIQGIAGGVPVPISGSITANNASVGLDGAIAPGSSTQIGGPDETGNLESTRTYDVDSGAGSEYVLGVSLRKTANGGSVELGTNTNPVRTDPTGTTTQPVSGTVSITQPVSVVGNDADGTPPTGNPVLAAGFDGTNVQTIATDGYGTVLVSGRDAVGAAPTVNPVVIGAVDTNGNVVRIRVNSDGTIATSDRELATFTAIGSSITTASNKSMTSVLNTSSTKVVKIHEIYLVNVQTSSVTGVEGKFELHRMTGHSSGASITPTTMDTADTLDAGITVRAGATVSGEVAAVLWQSLLSTDDFGPGATDVESTEHIFELMFPIFSRKTDSGTKALTLRQNEGFTVKFTTNSATGLFDLMLVITQE